MVLRGLQKRNVKRTVGVGSRFKQVARQGAGWIKSERERVTQMGADTAGVKSMPSEKRKGGQCVSCGVNGAKRGEHLTRESTEAHRQDLAFAPDEIGG